MATATSKSNYALVAASIPDEGAARWLALLAFAFAGSIVLWVSAKTQVPFYPVPMTLQTLAIVVIAATYGFRLGLATILLYLAEGAFGLPVFSGTPDRGIGLIYMMGPTMGYLVGFVVATGIVGWFSERGAGNSVFKLFIVMALAATSILVLGFTNLSVLIGVETAWNVGVVPFVLGDAVKVGIAALLVPAAGRLLRR